MPKQIFDKNVAARTGGIFNFEPHDLVLVVDTTDKLFDKNIEEEIPDGAVLDMAARGVINPVTVRRRDGQAVVIAGSQRTKRALVVNALIGKPYKGPVKSVHAAIERMKKVPASIEIAKRCIELCPQGVKIPVTVRNRGDEGEARAIKISEGLWRRTADPVTVQADNAQRLAECGWTSEDIAATMNVSVATVNRWRNVDLSKPREKKKRGKATRPSAKQVAEFRTRIVEKDLSTREKAIFAWILGDAAAPESLFEIKGE